MNEFYDRTIRDLIGCRMDQDTAIVVGIIGAVFAGVLMILKFMMPYVAKRRNGALSVVAPVPHARSVPEARQPLPSAPPMAAKLGADGTGPHDALGDTGRNLSVAPWADFSKTLHDMKSSFATKEDVEALSTTMNKRLDDSEDKVEKNAEKTQGHLTRLERAIGRLEGKLDK